MVVGCPAILWWGKWSSLLSPLAVGNSVLAIWFALFCDPLAAGEVPSLEKKDKRRYSEKVRDTGAALEALGGGLHAKDEIWQYLPFALQFTTCSALLEGFNSFAKHKAVKLQKLNPCNEILLPPFSQSCQNNDVFMVFYLMCEISSSQIWIKAFCAIYPLKRILSCFLLIDRTIILEGG